MYVPDRYRETDPEVIRAFVHDHPFATLVTVSEGGPRATHVPLLLHVEGDHDVLVGHLARANPQWHDFDGVRAAMAIFHGPHAYVSPRWYGGGNYVPTWNYAAVHLYGAPVVIDDPDEHREALRELTAHFEPPEGYSMDALPSDYLEAMVGATVAFRMAVDRIDAALKLSQNRTPEIRARVAAQLEASEDSEAQAVAALMRQRQA